MFQYVMRFQTTKQDCIEEISKGLHWGAPGVSGKTMQYDPGSQFK